MVKQDCQDKKCPFHGEIKTRGRTFVGTIVSNPFHKTVNVEWTRRQHIQKYERYTKKRTKISAHKPECITAIKGDKVVINECRPLSKTKKFVITKVLGKDIKYMEKEEGLEEGKHQDKEEEKKEPEKKPETTAKGKEQ